MITRRPSLLLTTTAIFRPKMLLRIVSLRIYMKFGLKVTITNGAQCVQLVLLKSFALVTQTLMINTLPGRVLSRRPFAIPSIIGRIWSLSATLV